MKPGERVRLITEAADSLSARPWAQIQLTLREFGVDTYDARNVNYDGPDDLTYCMEQIGGASDESLLRLHEFLVGEDAAPSTRKVEDEIWADLPARVFLSHVHANRHFVGSVKTVLEERYGIAAFVAHDDIHPSKQWRDAIKQALASCDAFVAFLDEGFHESQWCDQEVGWALGRDVPVMPVRPANFDRQAARDGFLEEHQDLLLGKARSTPERWLADQVLQNLLRYPSTRTVGVKALVEAFVHSGSFDTTRRLLSMIKTQPLLESQELRRLEYAVQTNRQVYDAVDLEDGPIPRLIDALVNRFEPPVQSDPWGDEEPF